MSASNAKDLLPGKASPAGGPGLLVPPPQSNYHSWAKSVKACVQVVYKLDILETLDLPECFKFKTQCAAALRVLTKVNRQAALQSSRLSNSQPQHNTRNAGNSTTLATPSAEDIEACFTDDDRAVLAAGLLAVGALSEDDISPPSRASANAEPSLFVVNLYSLNLVPDTSTINLHTKCLSDTWKLNLDRCQEYEQGTKVSLFGYILNHVSDESKTKLELQANYPKISASNDVIELWKLIQTTHTISPTSNPEIRLQVARDQLTTCRQAPGTEISQFIVKHKELILALQNCGDVVDQKREVINFLSRLDSTVFQSFTLDVFEGRRTFPATLSAAYLQVETYYSTVKGIQMLTSNGGNSKASTTNGKALVADAKDKTPCKFCKVPGHCVEDCRKFASFMQTGPEAVKQFLNSKGKGGKGTDSTGDDSGKGKKKGKKKKDKKKIGNGQQQKSGQQGSAGKSPSQPGDKTSGNQGSFLGADLPGNLGGTGDLGSRIMFVENGLVCVNDTIKAFASSDLDGVRDTFILDTGSTVHIVNHSKWLSDVDTSAPEISIQGIADGVNSTTVGILPIFGQAYYVPQCPMNLISLSCLENDGFRVVYDNQDGSFKVQVPSKGWMTFQQVGGLYLLQGTYRDADRSKLALAGAIRKKKRLVSSLDKSQPAVVVDLTNDEQQKAVAFRFLHEATAHPSDETLIRMISSGSIANCPVPADEARDAARNAQLILGPCQGCSQSKVVKDPEPPSQVPKPAAPAEQLFMDIFFLANEANKSVVPYLFSVAKRGNFFQVARLANKTANVLRDAVLRLATFFKPYGFEPKIVHTDSEAVFKCLKNALAAQGILLVHSTPGKHNKTAERNIRTFKEAFFSVLKALRYILPKKLYPYLVDHVVHSLNATLSSKLEDDGDDHQASISPMELITGKTQDFSVDLRIKFGELVAVYDNLAQGDARASLAVALGRDFSTYQGFFVFIIADNTADNKNLGKVVTRSQLEPMPITQDILRLINDYSKSDAIADAKVEAIVFDEGHSFQPAGAVTVQPTDLPNGPTDLPNSPTDFPNGPTDLPNGHQTSSPAPTTSSSISHQDTAAPADVGPSSQDHRGDITGVIEPEVYRGEATQPSSTTTSSAMPSPGAAATDAVPPDSNNRSSYNFRSRGKFVKHWGKVAYCFNISIKKAQELYPQLADHSVKAELSQMLEMGAWAPVAPRRLRRELLRASKNGKKLLILPCHLFLKMKYLPDGLPEKLKARLVAGGDRQEELAEHMKSSPTVQLQCVLCIACIAARMDYVVVTCDVKGAYLNAYLPKDSKHFMRLPKELVKIYLEMDPSIADDIQEDGTIVVELLKALYGLQESALLWYQHISSFLESLGSRRTTADGCVFTRGSPAGGDHCIIALYVDDLFVAAQTAEVLDRFLDEVTSHFEALNVHRGASLPYLGMTFQFDTKRKLVRVDQVGYIDKVLQAHSNLVKGAPTTPSVPSLVERRPGSDDEEKETSKEDNSKVNKRTYQRSKEEVNSELLNEKEKKTYLSLLMKLAYLAKRTRPDILFTVSYLATKSSCPTGYDMQGLIRVLSYLASTKDQKLTLQPSSLLIHVYVDASFAIHADAKSHTGVIMSMGYHCCPVDFQSTKQVLTTRSSTEAELVALDSAVTSTLWLQSLMQDLGYPSSVTVIYQDNRSTMRMAETGRVTKRTRHIDVRYFYVKEHLDRGLFRIVYVPSEEMVADILTKPLVGLTFQSLKKLLLGEELSHRPSLFARAGCCVDRGVLEYEW